ncbi:MAG: hypothetical protein HPY83_06295 [Anaerolineae bacterium]|nr:hypothetical protein [Anaerolineae bacterium]
MKERAITVFVSATADLEPEREVVGEALARFPVALPWRIARTPRPGEQTPAALEEVRRSDFCLVLLGGDITAPVGAELVAGRDAGVPVYVLVKDVPHTPAERFFQYNSVETWESFSGTDELRRLVVRHMAQGVVDRAIELGLSADEAARLVVYLREEKPEEPGVAGHGEPQGAQDAAVIVSDRERRRRG